MKKAQLKAFEKEIGEFPIETKEDIFTLVNRYIKGENLSSNQFKTFKIDKETKIQEFKVKDHRGNWRAISCIVQGDQDQGDILVFVYAFHKKSQALLEKDKNTIRERIKRIEL